MAGVTEELAKTTVAISYKDLPASVVKITKQVLLDSIGCALAGRVVDRARISMDLVNELGGRPQATIIGAGQTSSPLAAYANGELINALDFDPLGPLTGHVAPYVLPPAIALAERAKASGQALITAIAMALEVGGRVASSLPGHRLPTNKPPFYETNPRFTFGVTVFGGVAGAGKALSINAKQLAHAFGLAGTNIPGPTTQKWEHTFGPATMMKYGCSTGLLAQLATTSTLLAERGFTGDTTILDDGEYSFKTLFGVAYFEPTRIVKDLGKVWHDDAITIKAVPCCGANHSAIQALARILSENKIAPEDIEEIVVKGDPLMLTPNRAGKKIVTFADAQFSDAYIFAVIPYYGSKPSPAWQMPGVYTDPRVVAMMKKVKTVAHPQTSELIAARIKSGGWTVFRDALVEVKAKRKTYTAEEKAVKGSSGNPMSDEEIRAKFLTNASYSSITMARAEQVADTVYNIEKVKDVSQLAALLRVE